MNKTEMISDYIDSQKLLNVAKLKDDFVYFDLICKLSKITNFLHESIIKNNADNAEIQVLDTQIRNLYIGNVQNKEILFNFDKNMQKISKFVENCAKKYNLKLCST